MPVSIFPELIKDSGWQETFGATGILVGARVDRSFFGKGSAGTDADAVQSDVLAAVKVLIPEGTAHTDRTEATAREYRVVPWASNTGAEVIVTYVYDGHGGSDNTYTIEVVGGVRQVPTDSEFDGSGNLQPIEVNYWKEWNSPDSENPSGIDPYTATVTDMPVLRPLGGICLTKRVSDSVANSLETNRDIYLGYTNNALFRGKAANTYLCTEITVQRNPYQGINIARIRWDYLPETWDGWARFRNDELGVPPNIWRDWNATYDNMANSNGYKRCKTYLRANMTTLFNLVTA